VKKRKEKEKEGELKRIFRGGRGVFSSKKTQGEKVVSVGGTSGGKKGDRRGTNQLEGEGKGVG